MNQLDQYRLRVLRSVIGELDEDNKSYFLSRLESGDTFSDIYWDLGDAIEMHCSPTKAKLLFVKLDQAI